jgi:hypothetical protein
MRMQVTPQRGDAHGQFRQKIQVHVRFLQSRE